MCCRFQYIWIARYTWRDITAVGDRAVCVASIVSQISQSKVFR